MVITDPEVADEDEESVTFSIDGTSLFKIVFRSTFLWFSFPRSFWGTSGRRIVTCLPAVSGAVVLEDDGDVLITDGTGAVVTDGAVIVVGVESGSGLANTDKFDNVGPGVPGEVDASLHVIVVGLEEIETEPAVTPAGHQT